MAASRHPIENNKNISLTLVTQPDRPAETVSRHRHISSTARLLGAAITGLVTEPVFQPIDTMVKRLQNNKSRVYVQGQPISASYNNLGRIVFDNAYGKPLTAKFASLYQALSVAMFYSVIQRSFKFGGQPVVYKHLDHQYGDKLRERYGVKTAKTMLETMAGVAIGMGEPLLLPIDSIKVKLQVGVVRMQDQTPGKFKKLRSIAELVKAEKFSLYNGWEATLARNVPGSLTLFGMSAFMQHHVYHLDNCRHATFAQSLISSAVGALASVLVTNPADVLKVRAQAISGQGHVNILKLFSNTVRQEGVRALYKGVGLRGAVAVPKLSIVKTLSDYISHRIDDTLEHQSSHSSVSPDKR